MSSQENKESERVTHPKYPRYYVVRETGKIFKKETGKEIKPYKDKKNQNTLWINLLSNTRQSEDHTKRNQFKIIASRFYEAIHNLILDRSMLVHYLDYNQENLKPSNLFVAKKKKPDHTEYLSPEKKKEFDSWEKDTQERVAKLMEPIIMNILARKPINHEEEKK